MEVLSIHPNRDAPIGVSYLPIVPNEDFETYPRISHTREAIVEFICVNDIHRPLQNIVRPRCDQLKSIDVSPSGHTNDREFISPI